MQSYVLVERNWTRRPAGLPKPRQVIAMDHEAIRDRRVERRASEFSCGVWGFTEIDMQSTLHHGPVEGTKAAVPGSLRDPIAPGAGDLLPLLYEVKFCRMPKPAFLVVEPITLKARLRDDG